MEIEHVFQMSATPSVRGHLGEINWLLWIEQDSQGNRFDRLYAGRVKLQDDPISTTYCVLYDAVQKLESSLGGGWQDPLF